MSAHQLLTHCNSVMAPVPTESQTDESLTISRLDLPAELADAITRAADDNERSVPGQIRFALKEWLNRGISQVEVARAAQRHRAYAYCYLWAHDKDAFQRALITKLEEAQQELLASWTEERVRHPEMLRFGQDQPAGSTALKLNVERELQQASQEIFNALARFMPSKN